MDAVGFSCDTRQNRAPALASWAVVARSPPMAFSEPSVQPGQFTFVRKEDRGDADGGNMASSFARQALRDEFSKADGSLASDMSSVLRGEAIYLPNFHCARRDYALLASLAREMEAHEGEGMINWSKHLKHENPDFSSTFHRVVNEMSAHFDVEVYATRLNFYRDGSDWKPFHHDSHAYGGREQREDFTMGASFGGERELAFLHEPSGQQFSFPQNNGDVFAFTTEVNKRFKHGVPKLTRGVGGPRFSIIAWGRRRTLNANNGGGKGMRGEEGEGGRTTTTTRRDFGAGGAAAAPPRPSGAGDAPRPENELVMGSGEVSALIRAFVRAEEASAMGGGIGARDTARGGGSRSASGSSVGRFAGSKGGLGGPRGSGGERRDASAAAAAAREAALAVPAGAIGAETRGSAPTVAKLRASLGAGAYASLREAARTFQRGESSAEAFYDVAEAACGEAELRALAETLPDAGKRVELLAVHAGRLKM